MTFPPAPASILKAAGLAALLAAMASAAAQPAPAPVPTPAPAADLALRKQQVTEAERAFARSMAERDHAAFTRHLSEQALFFNGSQVLQGKAAVATGWKPFFDGAQAPFSWEPDQVEVLGDGQLAISTGPVRDPSGKPVARFNSVWRWEAPGVWRVVIDKGAPWEGK